MIHFLFLSVAVIILIVFAVLVITPFRRALISKPLYLFVKKQKSKISTIEKQALTAGNAGFEKGLFSGRPDWAALRKLPALKLTSEELAILNGPVNEICAATDDWDIRFKKHEIPEFLWDMVRKYKLFGLRVPKERGGYSLSFQAQSLILGKIASRSVDVATMIELPTSLWPDEIIEKYGTDEQKQYYMPRFSDNKEIVAFAVTGTSNGSDATAMRDVGVVEYGVHDRKKILGVRLSFKKRYITFAPKATLVVLGFQIRDPENVLGKGIDVGISLALIPTNYPGIKIGRRHLPTNVAFPNGPIQGENIFIPIDWVIGGAARAGEGWRMIMECLFVGRAIALPSASVGGIKVAFRTSAMYARVRRQFGSPIAKFEGIEEPLARLTENVYLTESARSITAAMVDSGDRPLAVSSLMKYRVTEIARQSITDAMDIHGGRAIMDGPSNYLMSAFLAAPIAVTVEGANIVTRSIITFAQGVLQTHPYLYEELESCDETDTQKGVVRFERALFGHVSFLIANIFRSFFHSLTNGVFGSAPYGVPSRVSGWYKDLWRMSANVGAIADITTLLMAGSLKKRQKLSGRLADALSELFLLASVLKRFEDDGFPDSDYPIVELCMTNGLFRLQEALTAAIRNFPYTALRPFLSVILFPLGAHRRPARDTLGHDVVELVTVPGDVLDRLSRYMYTTRDPEDMIGRLEVAFTKAYETEGAQKKLDLAVKANKVKRMYGVDWIQGAEDGGILTKQEAADVRELDRLVEKAIAVDDFDVDDIRGS